MCVKEPLLLFQQHCKDGSNACDSLSPAHRHVRGCLLRRGSCLSNTEQTCPERMEKPSQKAAPAPNSHIKPLLWALLCQSLDLGKDLDPFLLISLQKVSSCPLTTQTQSTLGVLGQECCWNSQHLPASLKYPHGKRESP